MDLNEIREAIDLVDRLLNGNINDRFALTEMVADCKLKTGDEVYKPDREAKMQEDFSSEEPMGYIQREIVLQSRRKQYAYFRDHDAEDRTFTDGIGRRLLATEEGDRLCFRIGYAEDGSALSLASLLRVLSDMPCRIERLDAASGKLSAKLTLLEDGDGVIREFAYLLYKECSSFEIIQEEEL